MKKTLLALAVAALSANAFAVNLDNNTDTQSYAQEINVVAAGTILKGVEAKVTAGFALATDGYVRFNLANGATFSNAPAAALDLTSSAAGAVFTVSAGGAGENYVIFRTTGQGIANTDVLTLDADIAVTSKSAVGVTYNLYETAGNAVAQTGSLRTRTGTLVNFRSGLNVTAVQDTNIKKINAISGESKAFEGATAPANRETGLTTLGVDAVTGVMNADGIQITEAHLFSAYSWTLNGNFSAAAAAAGLADATNSFTIAADKQSATLAGADGLVTYTVTGADEIAETNVSAVFSATSQTGYTVPSITITNAAVLAKNGESRDVDLALKPGGVFSNFVRISNKDTIPGAFSLRVIADDGQSVSFPLSAVEGQSGTLAAGASTTQMTIQQIFDAAQAAGLALSGEGKLRLQVTGQVNDLDVQTYTVATDGTTFSTF